MKDGILTLKEVIVMKKDVEQILKNADFSKGSNHKEELREMLFGNQSAKIVKFGMNRELSDDELDMVSAAGLYEEKYKNKNKFMDD